MSTLIELVMFLFVHLQTGQADSIVITTPIIFGYYTQLECTTNNTDIQANRPQRWRWIGGPYNTLLNRVRSDHSKYSVALRKDQFRSILTISIFSESDVDCEYSCESGLDVARTTLQLNENDYEFLPAREQMSVTSSLKNGHLYVDIHFVKVWPTPVCDVVFEKINLTHSTIMSKRKNGKLYHVNIGLQHVFVSDVCSGELIISCLIGSKRIEVERKQFDTCTVTVPIKDRNVLNKEIFAVFVFVLVVFVIVVVLVIRRTICLKSYLCGYSFKTLVEPLLEKTALDKQQFRTSLIENKTNHVEYG